MGLFANYSSPLILCRDGEDLGGENEINIDFVKGAVKYVTRDGPKSVRMFVTDWTHQTKKRLLFFLFLFQKPSFGSYALCHALVPLLRTWLMWVCLQQPS